MSFFPDKLAYLSQQKSRGPQRYDQYRELNREKGDNEIESPDFVTFVHLFVKFTRAIMEKFEAEFDREMTLEEYNKSLKNTDLEGQFMEMMFNFRYSLLPMMLAMFKLNGGPIPPEKYNMESMSELLHNVDVHFSIADFDIHPETLAARIIPGWVAACKNTAKAHHSDVPFVACPVIYTKLFSEMFTWINSIFLFYRFNQPLPPEIECQNISREEFTTLLDIP